MTSGSIFLLLAGATKMAQRGETLFPCTDIFPVLCPIVVVTLCSCFDDYLCYSNSNELFIFTVAQC